MSLSPTTGRTNGSLEHRSTRHGLKWCRCKAWMNRKPEKKEWMDTAMDRWMSEWFLFPGLFIWRCDCAPIVHGTKNNISLYTARFPELAKMNIPLHQVDMANITWGWSSSYPQDPKNHCTLQRRWVWMCAFCSVFWDLQFPPVTWDPSRDADERNAIIPQDNWSLKRGWWFP